MHLTQKHDTFGSHHLGVWEGEICPPDLYSSRDEEVVSYVARNRGIALKKHNTYELYTLALAVHPITELSDNNEKRSLNDIFWPLLQASVALNGQLGKDSIFSPSLKRSAGAVLRNLRAIGITADVGEVFKIDRNTQLSPWQISPIIEATKEFETVLANELPGLATYIVSQKGIFSTDHLISQADDHFAEEIKKHLGDARKDVCEAGKCLAFELSTASAFHMWRALETAIEKYYVALTNGRSLEDNKIERNWFAYIKALKQEAADSKITDFLDHIRREYRNPITHPTQTVEPNEALDLFGAGLSAIGQVARATLAKAKSNAPPQGPLAVAPQVQKAP